MKMGAGRDGVFVRWSIPGLKLVPACSPNGSIDHYSVPFSNQRTATLLCPTQERTHFNWEKQTQALPLPLWPQSVFPPPNLLFPIMH